MKTLSFVVAFCLFGFCTSEEEQRSATDLRPVDAEQVQQTLVPLPEIEHLGSGAYLASRFAQQNQDWKSANGFIDDLLNADFRDGEITRRAMILAMGAGEPQKAVELARKIAADRNDISLSIAQLFLITDALSNDDAKEAGKILETLAIDSTANFVKPFLVGWVAAANNTLKIDSLQANTLQLYHAILISDFLKNNGELEKILNRSVTNENDNPADMERIAELFSHAGLKDRAVEIYKKIQKEWPTDDSIQKKIDDVKAGRNKPLFETVKSAKHGMATAYHDISAILYRDYNDESARIFANLALMLMPDMLEPKLMLAQISARHKQYDDAIAYYKSVPENDKNALNAQFKISELLEESGDMQGAIDILEQLAKTHDDIEIQMNIGDFYRRQENFAEAIKAYDKAFEKIGGTVPPEHWGLHYARGICYEQLDDWPSAEKELKAALELQPDHPHVLNHLGYGWAEKGVHLDQALELIRRAVELRPEDGYIVDSLGWVMYQLGNFTDAVPNLERAVALLPYDSTINDHLGDAYWKVGREREARFQWMRAKNHSKDEKLIATINDKLISGLKEETKLVGKTGNTEENPTP